MATRNLAAEQDSLRAVLESQERGGSYTGTPGADVTQFSPAQNQLLQESINMRTYGSAAGPRETVAAPTRSTVSGVLNGSETSRAAAPTATAVAAPTESTLPTTDDAYSRYGVTTESKTKEQLQQEAIDAIQGQLTGIEERYSGILETEGRAGEGRSAQGRALGFASGTQYSPFQETRQTEIEEYNRGVVAAINADMQNEINNLYAQARGEATESYEAQQGRAMEMANSYINQMTENYRLDLQERQLMFDQAMDIADQTGTYGGSPTLEMLQWIEQVNQQQAESARSDEYLAIAQQDAASRGLELREHEGNLYEYDPRIGFEGSAVLVSAATPKSTSGGAVDRNNPLTRDAIYAYGQAGGDITNLSDNDVRTLEAYYTAGSGAQSPANPGDIFVGVGGTGSGVFQF
jgi:hypothetical protein